MSLPLGFLLELSASWVACTYSVVASFILFGKYFYVCLPPSWGFLGNGAWAFIFDKTF